MRAAIKSPFSRWKANLSTTIQTSQRLGISRFLLAIPLLVSGVCFVYSILTPTGLPYWRHPEMSSWLHLRDSIGGVALLMIPIAHLLPRGRSRLAVSLLGVGKVCFWAYIASLMAFFLLFGRFW